jgi:CheY-like chemotaxis protein
VKSLLQLATETCSSVSARAVAPGRHVLVVEDNEDNRETLVMLLESFGHVVIAAPDGPSGVRAGIASHPEVAIVDIGLPGFDGFEVCRRLRKALGRSVTLVALTGYGLVEDRERSRAAGFDVHLTKPADAATLETVIRRPPARSTGTEAGSTRF